MKVEKNYVFDGPHGKETLADLFEGRSQLIVNHFMFGPGWKEGCVGCSFAADHIDGALVHLEHHDVALSAVSRAPSPRSKPIKKRMGWQVKWVSSYRQRLQLRLSRIVRPRKICAGQGLLQLRNARMQSEEMPGISVFYKDAKGDIFHTYSCMRAEASMLIGTYMLPRHHAEGPQRDRPKPRPEGLGAAPRRLPAGCEPRVAVPQRACHERLLRQREPALPWVRRQDSIPGSEHAGQLGSRESGCLKSEGHLSEDSKSGRRDAL